MENDKFGHILPGTFPSWCETFYEDTYHFRFVRTFV
jgi:hypothetical protein